MTPAEKAAVHVAKTGVLWTDQKLLDYGELAEKRISLLGAENALRMEVQVLKQKLWRLDVQIAEVTAKMDAMREASND